MRFEEIFVDTPPKIVLDSIQNKIADDVLGKHIIYSGSGSGKCHKHDCIIESDKGLFKISELYEKYKACDTINLKVHSMDKNSKMIKGDAIEIYDMGISVTNRITLRNGQVIEVTPEHQIIVLNKSGNLEWKRSEKLNYNDFVAIPKTSPFNASSSINCDYAYFLGLIIADSYMKKYITFSNNNNSLLSFVEGFLASQFDYKRVRSKRNRKHNNFIVGIYRKDILVDIREKYGYDFGVAKTKQVPNAVLTSSNEVQIAFLQGYFDCEASVGTRNFECTSASYELLKIIQLMLLRFSIRSAIKIKKVKSYPHNKYWRLTISGHSLRIFRDRIGFKNDNVNSEKLDKVCKRKVNSNIELLPNQQQQIKDILSTVDYRVRHSNKDYANGNRTPSLTKAIKIANLTPDLLEAKHIKHLAENFFFEQVIDIQGAQSHVYDLCVLDHHSYVGDGVINHNTTVVCERVSRLIENHGVFPNSILLLSYSRDAAQVLRNRLKYDVSIRTVHSLCYLILINELEDYDDNLFHAMGKDNIQVCSGWKQRNIILDIIGDDDTVTVKEVIQEIAYCKGRLQYDVAGRLSTGNSYVDNIMYVYELEKYKQRMIDFGDYVILCLAILKSSDKILNKYRMMFPYIIVDEGQDTLYSLHKIIELLVQDNICYFLDNRQSIYSFTGINLVYTLNIHTRYNGMKQWNMQNNYRSQTSIVKLGNLIADDMRFDNKPMTPIKTGVGKIEYLGHFDSQPEEAEAIVNIISGPDVMILYRTNAQAMSIEVALRKRGIPYYIRGLNSFFDFPDVKDILAYIRLSRKPKSESDVIKQKQAFNLVFNRPNRYFGRVWKHQFDANILHKDIQSILKYSRFTTSNNRQYHSWINAQDKLSKQLHLMARFKYPSDVSEYVRSSMGYDDWHIKNSESNYDEMSTDNESSIEEKRKAILSNLNEFDVFLRSHDDFDEVFEQTENHKEDFDGVCLSTVHRSKGSEEKTVFIIGLTKGIFPHIRGNREEELRLFYVACTRAMNSLYLSSAPIKHNLSQSLYIEKYITRN